MKISLFIIVWVSLLSACSTPAKLNKLMNKLPKAAAKECAKRYPVKESIDTVIIVDSAAVKVYENELFLLWKQLDSVLSVGCDTQYIESIKEIIKTKPAKIETKYVIKTQENTAKIEAVTDSLTAIINGKDRELMVCEYDITKIRETSESRKKQRNRLFWLLVLMTIFAFRKQILKLIS